MKPSEIKLEEFNNCPGADRIKKELYERNLDPLDLVDLPQEIATYYENDSATLVIAIKEGPTGLQVALALGQIAVDYAADEFHWKIIDGRYVIRLWWD